MRLPPPLVALAAVLVAASCVRALDTTTAARPAQESQVSLSNLLKNQATTARRSATSATTSSPAATYVPTTVAAAATTTTTTGRPQFQSLRPVLAARCQYNNQSYALGQRWNDDCLQSCECVAATDPASPLAVSACRPRCPSYIDPPGAGCTLQRSKEDACCLDWLCEPDAKAATSAAPTTTTTTTSSSDEHPASVTTTELRLPSTTSAPSTTLAVRQPAPTSTPPPPTTVTTAATSARPTLSSQPRRPASPATTVASRSPKLAAPTTTQAARAPKQPQVAPTTPVSHVLATQAPNNPPLRPESLVTSTANPPAAETETPPLEARSSPADLSPTPTSDESEEVEPDKHDLCIIDNNNAYKVGQVWSEECRQTCRCVFKAEPRDPMGDATFQRTLNYKNGSLETEIRCSLPPFCRAAMSAALLPSAGCPKPKLIVPYESSQRCTCPEVGCGELQPPSLEEVVRTIEPSSSSAPTTAAPSTSRAPQLAEHQRNPKVINQATGLGCRSKLQGGRTLRVGETFNDECLSMCTCHEDGEIRCKHYDCPRKPQPGEPCVEYTNKDGCCESIACPKEAPEPRLQSAAPTTTLPTTSTQQPQAPFRSCALMGKVFLHNETLPEEIRPRDGERICICSDSKIVCLPDCQPLAELPPEELECAPSQAIKTEEDGCPKWSCPNYMDYALMDFQVVPTNATSVEVNFELPAFALNRRGKAQLNYTGLPLAEADGSYDAQPPAAAQWSIRSNIKTSDGVFYNRKVRYYLNNLKAAHRYWFRLVVHFADQEPPFDEPLESQLVRVSTPELPEPMIAAPTTSASTTSSSTTQAATSTTPQPPVTRILHPVIATTQRPASSSSAASPRPSTMDATSTQATVATSVSTTQQVASSNTDSSAVSSTSEASQQDIPKASIPEVDQSIATDASATTPCAKSKQQKDFMDGNSIGGNNGDGHPLAWESIQNRMGEPLQRYALHLFVALSVMTVLFVIMSYLYLKKSSVIAPITPPSGYDNPTFTKLVSYYANQPHVLLVDENSQNYNNDVILAKQKNLEVDQSSPLHNNNSSNGHHNGHHHHHHPHHHQLQHNGKQHLI